MVGAYEHHVLAQNFAGFCAELPVDVNQGKIPKVVDELLAPRVSRVRHGMFVY